MPVKRHWNALRAKGLVEFAKPSGNFRAALWAGALWRDIVMPDFIPVAFDQDMHAAGTERGTTLCIMHVAHVNVAKAGIHRDYPGAV